MSTEIIRPTAHTVVDPTVDAPANAYDGSLSTYARCSEDVLDGEATLRLENFQADSAPGSRTTAHLVVLGRWDAEGPGDCMEVYARKRAADPWTLVDRAFAPDVWPTANPSLERRFDITAIVGTWPATDWQVALRFVQLPKTDPPTSPPFLEG